MVICIAHVCATQSGTHRISLSQFPTDQKIRKCWIDRLNRGKTATTKFVPSKHSKICMKHFDDSQFLISPKFAESIGFGQVFRVRLKPDAVPTIFDNPRKKSSKERNSALAISKKKMKHEQVQLNQTVMPPKDKKCACHICNTMFTNRFNLQRHARVIHSGEKSFKCKTEGCQETFSYNRDLKVHKTKCHAEGQTFKCKSCDKVFIYRSSWKRHRESCLSTEINKVNCTVCGKFFKTSDSLRHHRKYVHEKQNLKGVQCDLCGRIFSRPQELGKHKKSMFHKDDK